MLLTRSIEFNENNENSYILFNGDAILYENPSKSYLFDPNTLYLDNRYKDSRIGIAVKDNVHIYAIQLKDIGIKRLIGMTAATAIIPYGVIKGSQAIFGVSNEEADAANDFVAPWAKDSQKIYMRDPETDELYYLDYNRM